ncbi:EAL domain-containing protein [Methylobacterium nigriterrae]|uniref:EAL domain-containing protein n=1 Tax=Methylobacterium nigriterrae TaxID=3127512 RepID=UPI0030137076
MGHPDDLLLLPAGALLFREGETGDAAYQIVRGTIEIFLEQDGAEVVLARRGAGEIIGEMAIIDRRPRSASARVAADCALTPITAAQIERRIAATDPILRMCLGIVIDHCRETLALVRGEGGQAHPSAPASAPGPAFQAAVDVLRLERELTRALQQGQLAVFLQPLVSLASGRLTGFEALMRWHHPEHGLILPGRFIGVAEASGLITRMTEWCLGEVARAYAALDTAARLGGGAEGPLVVSVNVSGHDLSQPAFAARVEGILAEAGMPPEGLSLEITESILMRDPAGAGAVLDACRRRGIGIAIDDFGTGYSSLSHLSTLPISTLKIDRAFVQALGSDAKSTRIVGTILRLARDLGIPAVAEGIETAPQATQLAALGCACGQGFLFGRPAPLLTALQVARDWRPADAGPGARRAAAG